MDNLKQWKNLQEREYFEQHPKYKGLIAFGDETMKSIEQFREIKKTDNIIIIGCGYGREVLQISPFVTKIYGIDVNDIILTKAEIFLEKNNVDNFIPTLAENWKVEIPDAIFDIAYSMVVMQHLSKDIVRDYFKNIPQKLCSSGSMIIQFLESLGKNSERNEPSFSWTVEEIKTLAKDSNLELKEIISKNLKKGKYWHWGHFIKL